MLNIEPSLDQFLKFCDRGNLIPVTASLLGDRDTPVTIFERLKHEKYAFLLESVEHSLDSFKIGRYSFIGYEPRAVYEIDGEDIWRDSAEEGRIKLDAKPIEALREEMKRYDLVEREGLPPFVGGMIGYLGYDTVRLFEDLPNDNPNDLDMPDGMLMVTDTLVVVDHVRRRIELLALAHLDGSEGNPREAYALAVEKLERLHELLMEPLPERDYGLQAEILEVASGGPGHVPAVPEYPVEQLNEAFPVLSADGRFGVKSNVKKADFLANVEKAREYILAGDAFQIVGSQRFHTRFDCDPFDVYRALRYVNPSPYMFYLQMGEVRLAGSSPEILVRLEGEEVQLRPIAGTRPRGATIEEDKALEADLRADEKEVAEHVMLVDLGRNDVGRVCSPPTVQVDELMVVERYSHVMHIVSNVRGEIAPGKDAFDVLAASFPAGTLSGAPKIRAMEIIDELEPTRRGPYGGTVCYLSFNGNFDSCITIRTALLRGNDAYVQAGGGWVADSDPETEFQETVNKARGVITAIAQAQAGLD